ncbi:MAG TPA: sulfatase-like hydrolase/transferase [Bryobacteraceae bacterium]|nr:sulfatase-like hydrolase/transferase [Bryobacteraceae bacterium]
MTRREWLGSTPGWIAPLAAAQGVAQEQRPVGSQRPNIVMIISDQFRADNLGCMGLNPMNLTPNLDGLASRGVLFRNAITSQPVCAPARATLFTGQYAERHGVWHNGPGIDPKASTVATAMRQAGYSTNYIGKWHLAPNQQRTDAQKGPVPPQYRGGFADFWEASNELEHTSHAYEGEIFASDGTPIRYSGTYRSEFLTGRAVRFLKEHRGTKPFLLVVSYLNVHHQNDSDTYVPPKEYANRYKNFFVPQDLRSLPGSWPSQLSDYYGCVASMDDCVGTLLRTLKEEGLEQNTIVSFMSDHGCHFKTRNTEYKRSPHESSIHIPLIIGGPGFDRPAQVDRLVSHVDLAPTFLEAAGVAVPQSMQGRSFWPVISNPGHPWRDEVYIHMSEYMVGRILRTPEWTYAVATPKRQGWRATASSDSYVEYMLYDLKADPFQHVNLAGRAETREISMKLRQRMLDRIVEAGGTRPQIESCYFPYS